MKTIWYIPDCRALEQHKYNRFQDDGNNRGFVQVLYLSAEKNKATSWELRLYEALFLIGSKKVLYDLGIDDVEKKFSSGAKLKPDRRLLFTLCKELETNEQAKLVQYFQVHLYFVT